MKSEDIILGFYKKSSILSLTRLKGGVEGKVFHLVSDERSVVYKFLSKSRIEQFPNTIAKEVRIFKILGELGVNVPVVNHYSTESHFLS